MFGLFRLLLATLLLVAGALAFFWWQSEHSRTHRYDSLIAEAATRYATDPHLIRAVIWRESDFDELATGTAGERGLMQVTVDAATEWAEAEQIENFRPTDLFDPRTNILAGTWYLARARERWKQADDPDVFALAEYNAGRSNALRWASGLPRLHAPAFFQRIDFPTTRRYIQDIQRRHLLYRSGTAPGPFSSLWDKTERFLESPAGTVRRVVASPE
jgi:soluble lytic murein transglycosylase